MKKKMVASKVQSELSIQRTKLANRRTFLAYFRTSVSLIVAGAGLMKFIQNDWWFGIGMVCVVLAPIILALGLVDFIETRKLIRSETEYFENICVEDSESGETDNDKAVSSDKK